ncbi:MAG: hypothetical protein K1X39_09855 [Thermoflexales bacterium]|nr:hypothetical protein [Thermoflexales bacterium]
MDAKLIPDPTPGPPTLRNHPITRADLGEAISWWDYETCERCAGAGRILETPEEDLFCAECLRGLPRPMS